MHSRKVPHLLALLYSTPVIMFVNDMQHYFMKKHVFIPGLPLDHKVEKIIFTLTEEMLQLNQLCW